MATQTIRIEGLKELRRKLEKLSDAAAQDALEEAAKAGAAVWHDAAEQKSPGPHIEVEVLESSATSVTVGVGPDEDHFYYRFLEFGTRPHTIKGAPLLVFGEEGEPVYTPIVHHPGAAARPFLRPAADENEKTAEKAAAGVLRREIDKLTA